MSSPKLNADLIEEYKTLVAKEFRHAMKGKGKTEAEQKAFLKGKIEKICRKNLIKRITQTLYFKKII